MQSTAGQWQAASTSKPPNINAFGWASYGNATGSKKREQCAISRQKITTMLGFSKGHWEKAEDAHGDKRNPADLERWRGLAKIGIQTERVLLSEQADILEDFHGPGDLKPVNNSWPTL
jgi:hypothetical protein